jgi:hypothetical protein
LDRFSRYIKEPATATATATAAAATKSTLSAANEPHVNPCDLRGTSIEPVMLARRNQRGNVVELNNQRLNGFRRSDLLSRSLRRETEHSSD